MLAINGQSLVNATLPQAVYMLSTAGDVVQLKIRKATSRSRKGRGSPPGKVSTVCVCVGGRYYKCYMYNLKSKLCTIFCHTITTFFQVKNKLAIIFPSLSRFTGLAVSEGLVDWAAEQRVKRATVVY